jgi:hypothetical protein
MSTATAEPDPMNALLSVGGDTPTQPPAMNDSTGGLTFFGMVSGVGNLFSMFVGWLFSVIFSILSFLFFTFLYLMIVVPLIVILIIIILCIWFGIKLWDMLRKIGDGFIKFINMVVPIPGYMWNIIANMINSIVSGLRKIGIRLRPVRTAGDANRYKIRKGIPSLQELFKRSMTKHIAPIETKARTTMNTPT